MRRNQPLNGRVAEPPSVAVGNTSAGQDCRADMTFPELGHEHFNLSERELVQAWFGKRA